MPDMKKQEFCISCEKEFLEPKDKFGTVCQGCFTKSKRRDALMRAAVKQVLVAVVPVVCPHTETRGHCCRTKFNVIVLNRRLEPIEITGPYTMSAAERHAAKVQRQIDRKGK